MELEKLLAGITERLKGSASVSTVYGEPMTLAGKTIIPVAEICYGFGAGLGEGSQPGPEGARSGSGGGGGGCLRAKPLAVLEITEGETRVIPILDYGKLAFFAILAFALALLLGRKRS